MQTELLHALLVCPIALTVYDQSWVWAVLLFKLMSQDPTNYAPSPIRTGLRVHTSVFCQFHSLSGQYNSLCVQPCSHSTGSPTYLHCCLNYQKSRVCLLESKSPSSSALFPVGAVLFGHSQLYFLVLNSLQVGIGASTWVWEQQHPSHSRRVSPACVSCCFNCLQSE